MYISYDRWAYVSQLYILLLCLSSYWTMATKIISYRVKSIAKKYNALRANKRQKLKFININPVHLFLHFGTFGIKYWYYK